MSEWWTYRLYDFLLFSERVYFRMFERANADLWPAHILALLFGAVIVHALLKPTPHATRMVNVGLGALWLWIAWSFFWHRYAAINWAAPYVAPLFVVQGLALLALGFRASPHQTPPAGHVRFAAALVAFGVFAYPLLAPASGRPLGAAEVFGIAPDPTAVVTLAWLATSSSTRLLLIVPLLWIVVTGLTLWTMGVGEAAAAPICALAAVAIAVTRRGARAAVNTPPQTT